MLKKVLLSSIICMMVVGLITGCSTKKETSAVDTVQNATVMTFEAVPIVAENTSSFNKDSSNKVHAQKELTKAVSKIADITKEVASDIQSIVNK